MLCAGIDGGSRAIKIVITDGEAIVASGIIDQGVEQERLSEELLGKLLADCGIRRCDVERIVATGCSRNIVSFADTTITEISCHARGVRHLIPDALTIIEVGGQDSKFLRLNTDGTIRDFAMSDRCAAGSGRFLEILAGRLQVDLASLGTMAAGSTNPSLISSMCAVFAETEIIGLLASGADPSDIAAGVQASIASRIASMAGPGSEPPVIFTGGVALVPGMREALEKALSLPVSTSPLSQYTGALGASLLASRI